MYDNFYIGLQIKYQIENAFAENNIPTYREIIRETTKHLITMRNSVNIQTNGIKERNWYMYTIKHTQIILAREKKKNPVSNRAPL